MTFPDGIVFRKIEKNDYNKNYIPLLQHLTTVNPEEISMETFYNFVDNLDNSHNIYVLENRFNHIIIGTITLLIENKIIHNMGKVGHIEDVVVDPRYRGNKFGQQLIENVTNIAQKANCYKVILDCSEHNVPFYEKCNFQGKGLQMSRYF